MKDIKGQIVNEFFLTVMFVGLPLMSGGLAWFCLEMNRSKCAYQTFLQARQRLLRENQTVDFTLSCGKIRQKIHLEPLENLDHDKGALGLSDLQEEVSQFSADASHSWQQLQGLVSSASSIRSSP